MKMICRTRRQAIRKVAKETLDESKGFGSGDNCGGGTKVCKIKLDTRECFKACSRCKIAESWVKYKEAMKNNKASKREREIYIGLLRGGKERQET